MVISCSLNHQFLYTNYQQLEFSFKAICDYDEMCCKYRETDVMVNKVLIFEYGVLLVVQYI